MNKKEVKHWKKFTVAGICPEGNEEAVRVL